MWPATSLPFSDAILPFCLCRPVCESGRGKEFPVARPQYADEASREKTIIRTSVIGIIANVFLSAFKAVIGVLTNSIAIVLDAVNNISDAGSSLITIVGTKLAGKAPDKKHPFGHGRVEYLSAMIISVIVLYAGLTSLTESVKQIIHPETPDYSTVSLIIVGVAVIVKIVLGRYVKSVGVKVKSDSLINSGEDARLDAVICASSRGSSPELIRGPDWTLTPTRITYRPRTILTMTATPTMIRETVE